MGSNALASDNSSWGMHLSPAGRFVSTGGGVEPRQEAIVDMDTSNRRTYTGVDTASGDRLRECPVNTLGDFPRARTCGAESGEGNDNPHVRISLLEAECAGFRHRNKLLQKHAMLLELQKIDHTQQIAQLQLKVGGLESEVRMLRAARGVAGDTNRGALAVSPLSRELASHERERGLAGLGSPAREVRPAEAAARGGTVMDGEQGRPGQGWAVDGTSPRRNVTSQAPGGISGLALQQKPGRRLPAETPANCFRDSGAQSSLGEVVAEPVYLPASSRAEGGVNGTYPRLPVSPTSEDPPSTRRASAQACSGLRVERVSLASMPPDADSTVPVQKPSRARVVESREPPMAVVRQTGILRSTSSASASDATATNGEDLRPPSSHPLQDFWADHLSSLGPKRRPVVKAETSRIAAPSPTDASTSPCPSARLQRSESRLPSEQSGHASHGESASGETQDVAQATAEELSPGDDLKSCAEAGAAATTLPSCGRPLADMGSHTDPASFDDGQVLVQMPPEGNGASASSKSCAAALPCEVKSEATTATTAERNSSPALQWAPGKGAGVESRHSHVSFCACCAEIPSSSIPVGLCDGCPRIVCANCLLEGLEGGNSLMLEGLESCTRALLQGGKGDFYILECPWCLDESDKEIPPPPEDVPPMTHLLEELLRHDLSRSFRAPMDIGEYPTLLESAGRASKMDLGSMMSKLQGRRYPRRRGPGQFMEDLRRIWRNCRRIGGCDELGQPKAGTTVSGVVRCALVLEAMSEKFFAAHMSDQVDTVWPESAWDCYRQRKQQANAEARLKRLGRRESGVRAPAQHGDEAAVGVPDSCTVTAEARTKSSDCADGSLRERGFTVQESERAPCKRASVAMASVTSGPEKGEKRPRTVVPGTSTECYGVSPSSASTLVDAPQQVDCSMLDELCDVATEYATTSVTKV